MTYSPATELPTGQKMALVMLRKGDLAHLILEHLREMSVPVPLKSDWIALMDQGRVMRQFYYQGEQQMSRLALTPMGLFGANDVMRDMARRYGIHHITHGSGAGNRGPTVTCTCGWSTFAAHGREATLSRHAGEHMRQAGAGTLPDAYVLPQFSIPEAKAS